MSESELSDAAVLFGQPAREIETDDDQLVVYEGLHSMRNALMEAAEDDNVGVNQLARRLHVSPSSVSRFFGGDGDFRLSTAILYGRALGRRWSFVLEPDVSCQRHGNHSGTLDVKVLDVSQLRSQEVNVLPNTTTIDAIGMISVTTPQPSNTEIHGFKVVNGS